MGYSGAGGKLIHEKNQKQKISWHYPFNRGHGQFLIFLDAPMIYNAKSVFLVVNVS